MLSFIHHELQIITIGNVWKVIFKEITNISQEEYIYVYRSRKQAYHSCGNFLIVFSLCWSQPWWVFWKRFLWASNDQQQWISRFVVLTFLFSETQDIVKLPYLPKALTTAHIQYKYIEERRYTWALIGGSVIVELSTSDIVSLSSACRFFLPKDWAGCPFILHVVWNCSTLVLVFFKKQFDFSNHLCCPPRSVNPYLFK